MDSFTKGFAMACIIMAVLVGTFRAGVLHERALATVAENTATCTKCGATSQVIIREKK